MNNFRFRLQPRWYEAMSQLDIPCMLFWGDSDAVAPMDIPKYLATNVFNSAKQFEGKTIKGAGHFTMLENPKVWADTIIDFIKRNTK